MNLAGRRVLRSPFSGHGWNKKLEKRFASRHCRSEAFFRLAPLTLFPFHTTLTLLKSKSAAGHVFPHCVFRDAKRRFGTKDHPVLRRRSRVATPMNEYELMYIVPTSYTEEELGTIESHVAELIAKHGGTIARTARLGKFRFAYPIHHERFGYYVLARFTAERASVAGIEAGLRLNQKEILRHLILDAAEVGDGKYNLVQFQEVQVEGGDRRRRLPPKSEKVEDKAREEKEMKEGVAALEEGKAAPETGIDALSAEDLEKKIDAALEEKA